MARVIPTNVLGALLDLAGAHLVCVETRRKSDCIYLPAQQAAVRFAERLMALERTQYPTLRIVEIVESVCDEYQKNNMHSMGACSALRSMCHYWSEDPMGIEELQRVVPHQLDGLIDQLELMKAEILRRLAGP
jgi:hypothetical protein